MRGCWRGRLHAGHGPAFSRDARYACKNGAALRRTHPRACAGGRRARSAGGSRRHRGVSRLTRLPTGVLRGSQSPPLAARPRGCRRMDHGPEARTIRWPSAASLRRLGSRLQPREGQSDCGLDQHPTGVLHRGERRARQSTAWARVPVDRLPTLHAGDPARRGHPRRALVVGERGRQGMRPAQPTGCPAEANA